MTVDAALTATLKAEVKALSDDLLHRATKHPEPHDGTDALQTYLQDEWQAASTTGRTAFDLPTWREGVLAQVAVNWVLGCVFIRFCEDNGLITEPLLSSPDPNRRRWANNNQVAYFREHPTDGERAYLLHVFDTAAELPGLSGVFNQHNPLRLFGPSDDACRALIARWRATNTETGTLIWNFTDPAWDTRFLGDLYQDLSDHARKQYALLQTPEFVEAFILDRTLDPALAEFGLNGHDGTGFRLIDPACGSGHFLLGAFTRLAEECYLRAQGDGRKAAAARALKMVHGIDLNPFATAIARFRLLTAALRFSGESTLAAAPLFDPQVATGDSLLWGATEGRLDGILDQVDAQRHGHLYATEDADLLRKFFGQRYHAVVANPPYITPKDPAANQNYRDRYDTCHRQYSLAVPFLERLFQLALPGNGAPAGFVGQITANSFMKREFGKKLIEEYLARHVDLTHVIDTSGAYLPGHGTPTVILVGRNRPPTGDTLRAVLGIRGEPSQPQDPAKGLVWSSIVSLWDKPSSENDYIGVDDLPRTRLAGHPWSLQGGSAGPLKSKIESAASSSLDQHSLIGFGGISGEDNVFIVGRPSRRIATNIVQTRPIVVGEDVRDWLEPISDLSIWPYDDRFALLDDKEDSWIAYALWPYRCALQRRKRFGVPMEDLDRPWYEWRELYKDRLLTPLSIPFAFVATHNNFVLDRGGKVFKQSAPVIKLGAEAGEDEHLQLLGLLNSSAACFWMKQVFQGKPSNGVDRGLESEAWTVRSEFDGTKLKKFPVAEGSVLGWAARLDGLAQELGRWLPRPLSEREVPSAGLWAESERRVAELRAEMVWLQEELDWRCMHLYGVLDEDLSFGPDEVFALAKGERAFEIALARQIEAGDTTSEWFRRHSSTLITELPSHWPAEYRARVERRLELIGSDRFVNLLERPEYKRRWNWDSWESLSAEALAAWLATRLEDGRYWPAAEPRSVAQLADTARLDPEFVQVAASRAGRADPDLVEVVGELLASDAVPFLAAWRYKEPGLRKRASWEATWDLQRREDAGEDVGKIPVPPKYGSGDFASTVIWKARGKLDVPKERFVSYPALEREADPTAVYGWAGWDHLAQAQALAALYQHRLQQEGWSAERLVPVLAGLGELVPWVRQWHNDVDPVFGQRMGEFFAEFLDGEIRRHRLTTDQLAAWRPPPKKGRGRRPKKAS